MEKAGAIRLLAARHLCRLAYNLTAVADTLGGIQGYKGW